MSYPRNSERNRHRTVSKIGIPDCRIRRRARRIGFCPSFDCIRNSDPQIKSPGLGPFGADLHMTCVQILASNMHFFLGKRVAETASWDTLQNSFNGIRKHLSRGAPFVTKLHLVAGIG